MEDNTTKSGRQIITFGILMSINFPIYLFIWHHETPLSYHNAPLRIFATILCVILALKNYWPKSLKPMLPLYWYLVVTFTLPFFFIFMMLKNGASILWLMNLMSSIFFLILLFDFLSAIISLSLGGLIAFLAYVLTSQGFQFTPGTLTIMGVTSTFLAAFVIGGVFARNKEVIEYERIQTMKLLSSSIAHELRTPLASIIAAMAGLNKFLPSFFEAYEKAKESGIQVKNIRPNIYTHIKNIPNSVSSEVNYTNHTIDMLLLDVSNKEINQDSFSYFSAIDCIREALDRYPFRIAEHKNLVHFNTEEDFQIHGDKSLMIHVLFNLMKNALYYIESENKGDISIWIETTKRINIIHVKDTAKGMPKEILANLFKQFYTRRDGGTGVGLAFCKVVIQSFNGQISCHAIENEYTEFELKFAKEK